MAASRGRATPARPGTFKLVDYSGPTTILADNITIEGKAIKGSLEIGGANVTVRNSTILGTISTLDEQFPKASLTLDRVTIDSHGTEGKSVEGTNITVKNSEITGSASGGVLLETAPWRIRGSTTSGSRRPRWTT